MADVACLGILVADLLGRPIDSLPPRGRLGLVDEMTLHIGGCAANTGIDLARLGVPTAVLGKVGDDGLGDFVLKTLCANGLDTGGVIRDSSVTTSATMVLVDSGGERTFLHHLGANARYTPEDVDWNLVGGSRLLHIAGALVMPGIDGARMAGILKRAKDLGLMTSLDVVWDATGQWMRLLAPCLPHTDYFLPSLSEAQALTGRTTPPDVASALRDAGAGVVGLKLGEEGCFVQSADQAFYAPALAVHAVDGTGSGDAWDAGFICGILQGWDLAETARFANAVGALCVTRLGATAGVRSRQETEEFLQQTPPASAACADTGTRV